MRTRGVPCVLMQCHEFHFCLALCCTVFTAHALAWLKSHLCSQLTDFHVCCCASFHLHVIHVRLTLTRHCLVSTTHAIELVKFPLNTTKNKNEFNVFHSSTETLKLPAGHIFRFWQIETKNYKVKMKTKNERLLVFFLTKLKAC